MFGHSPCFTEGKRLPHGQAESETGERARAGSMKTTDRNEAEVDIPGSRFTWMKLLQRSVDKQDRWEKEETRRSEGSDASCLAE